MRHLAIWIVVIGSSVAVAQAPPAASPGAPPAPAPTPPAVDPLLVTHLRGWEQAMASSRSFWAACTAKRENKNDGSVTHHIGTVMCLKPGYARTRLETVPEPGQPPLPGMFEEYLIHPVLGAVFDYTGNGVDRATGKERPKTATEYRFPRGQPPRNVMTDFLSGAMTAEQVFKRFDLRLLKEGQAQKPGEAPDPNYIFIRVLPREAADRDDFEALTLVLFRPQSTPFGYLPAQVQFARNQAQIVETWSFEKPFVNHERIVEAKFQPVQLDATWVHSVQQAPPEAGAGAPPNAGVAPPGLPAGMRRP